MDKKSFLQTAQTVEIVASSSTSLSSFLLRRFLAFDFFDVGFGSSAPDAAAAAGGVAFEVEADAMAVAAGWRSAALAERWNNFE